jgi:predicted O-methyltransferase YrrM
MIDFENIQPIDPALPLMDARGVHNYMSTANIYGLINALAGEGKSYLEIGSYRGCSLAAAAMNNPKTKCTGIDNFTGVGYREQNEGICLETIMPYKNAKLIKGDYLEELPKLKGLFDCIFIDGPHESPHTLNQLELAAKKLKPFGYLIVDDIGFPTVKEELGRFKSDREDFVTVFKRETGKRNDRQWWNGIEVLRYTKTA